MDNPPTEYLLGVCRATCLRLRLQECEIQQVGISLRAGIIDAGSAVDWLADLGVLMDHEPISTGPLEAAP